MDRSRLDRLRSTRVRTSLTLSLSNVDRAPTTSTSARKTTLRRVCIGHATAPWRFFLGHCATIKNCSPTLINT